LVGADAAPYLVDPINTILKSDAEIRDHDEAPPPYTDPILRQRDLYIKLVAKLWSLNLLSFSTVKRATVGIFTVAKKVDDLGVEWLRLIFDCRQVNWLTRKPPKTHLATPGALAALDLSDEALGPGKKDAQRPFDGCFSAVDLVDAFYLFL